MWADAMENTPPPATPSEADNDVMCHCSGTRRQCIRDLHAQGKDLAAISRWTGALSGCGGCEWEIADYLKALSAEK